MRTSIIIAAVLAFSVLASVSATNYNITITGANLTNCQDSVTVNNASVCYNCMEGFYLQDFECVGSCSSDYITVLGSKICLYIGSNLGSYVSVVNSLNVTNATNATNTTGSGQSSSNSSSVNVTEGESTSNKTNSTLNTACGPDCASCSTVGNLSYCFVCDNTTVWSNYVCVAACPMNTMVAAANWNYCVADVTSNATMNSTMNSTMSASTANATSVTCGNVTNCSDCVSDNGYEWCFACDNTTVWSEFQCLTACPVNTGAFYGSNVCVANVTNSSSPSNSSSTTGSGQSSDNSSSLTIAEMMSSTNSTIINRCDANTQICLSRGNQSWALTCNAGYHW